MWIGADTLIVKTWHPEPGVWQRECTFLSSRIAIPELLKFGVGLVRSITFTLDDTMPTCCCSSAAAHSVQDFARPGEDDLSLRVSEHCRACDMRQVADITNQPLGSLICAKSAEGASCMCA